MLIGAIFALTVFNLAPSIVYPLQHGKNAYVAQRKPFETELYSLKLMDLVLPVNGHRIEFLNQFQRRYHHSTPLLSEPTQPDARIVRPVSVIVPFVHEKLAVTVTSPVPRSVPPFCAAPPSAEAAANPTSPTRKIRLRPR